MQQDYAKQYARLYRQHWWWRSREAAVVQTIRRVADLPNGAKILDVGCGDALSLAMLRSLAHDAEARGIEIDANTILPNNPDRHLIYDKPLGDAIYRNMRFDLVTALDVIEHIDDDRAAIQHMTDMLNPGGTLLITVPALPVLWTQHDEMNRHYRRYTRAGLTQLLAPFGEVLDMRYFYTALALPKLLLARLQRHREGHAGTPNVPPRVVNRLLQGYCRAEWSFAKRLPMPFGSSLIAAVGKPVEATSRMPLNTDDASRRAA